MEQDILLRMTDSTKTFPGVKALDGVSFELKKGTVHALMGENGAGKSTLMKCLFGIYTKDSGQIFLEGKEVNFKNSKEALNSGVAMVHQELNQALKRSVMDNLWLGRYPMIGGVMVNERKMLQDTKAIFEELEIDVDPHRIMSTMPVSQRQMVEIAKAVSYNSKVIVFDEPTIEFSYKNDDLHDPLINEYHALALKLATKEEIETIKSMAFKINGILKEYFLSLNVKLVDFKLEFGRLSDGTVVLADEISPDTCRFWDADTNEKLDKDRFRRDMGGVEDAYNEMMKRVFGE